MLLGFNLGLTDDAYDFDAALAAAPGAPFVFFCPSALEASRERAFLEARGATVAAVRRNPFHAPGWRQSGQTANDVYRKHRYALGGVLAA